MFHGWLPFLLVYLVVKFGYDRRALPLWTGIAWVACLVCFFLMPPAGAHLGNPHLPLNINYVFGFDDAHPQTWMNPHLYLGVWMVTLLLGAFVPAHYVLQRISKAGCACRLSHADSPNACSRREEAHFYGHGQPVEAGK
jgi:hypothetical protein